MGGILSRNKQKSTVEILEELDKEIDDLETNQADKEFNRRRSVGYLILTSLFLFVGSIVYWYIYHFQRSGLEWRDYVICLPLVLIYPLVVWILKWSICWWYEQSLSMDQRKLDRLKRRRRDILNSVKDKETYKVAKEILERFDPLVKQEKVARKAREMEQQLQILRRFASLEGLQTPSQQQLRRRQTKSRTPSPIYQEARNADISTSNASNVDPSPQHPPPPQPSAVPSFNMIPPTPRPASMRASMIPGAPFQRPLIMRPSGPFAAVTPATGTMMATPIRLPRPVIPRERSTFDKMLDYLLGEGPSSRYALVCQQCRSHNGMALKEEIEKMAFRCCYCFAFNPARRLSQPVLPLKASSSTPDDQQGDNNEQRNTSAENHPETSRAIAHEQSTRIHGDSDSRPHSRLSVASLDSTQSAPPFTRDEATESPIRRRHSEELLPTSTTPTMASSDFKELRQRSDDHSESLTSVELPRRLNFDTSEELGISGISDPIAFRLLEEKEEDGQISMEQNVDLDMSSIEQHSDHESERSSVGIPVQEP